MHDLEFMCPQRDILIDLYPHANIELQIRVYFLQMSNSKHNVLDCCLRVSIQCPCHTRGSMLDLDPSYKKRICSKTFDLLRQCHINRNEWPCEVSKHISHKYNCMSFSMRTRKKWWEQIF